LTGPLRHAIVHAVADTATPTPPADAAPRWQIAFLSFSILTLELAFIRQIPAEVRAISYFTNLILMATFFGLGLGCILQERRRLLLLLPAGVLAVFAFILATHGIVIYEASRSVHFWLEHDVVPGQARTVPLLPAALLAFVAAALPFVALGQSLARAMDQHPRLLAYGWDIAGSLLGTALFSASALIGLPPWVWVAVVMTFAAFLLTRSLPERSLLVAAGLSFLFFSQSPLPAAWSPYYLVQYRQDALGLRVFVNSSFHQLGIRFGQDDPAAREVQQRMLAKWGRPYQVYRAVHGAPPRRVLVLGAGTGNDIVVALSQGASQVVAVEIDPVILRLGQRLNAARPYDDPRVEAVVDDARHYLRGKHEPFDMIVFGTLDSQVLLSGHSNLRLENYVYTRESLTDARRLLRDGGLVVVYYSVFKDWLYARLYSTVRAVFGEQSTILMDADNALFNTTLIGAKGVPALKPGPEAARLSGALPVTDDWPFPYLERPEVGALYGRLLLSVAALVAGAVLLLRRIHPVTGLHADFLFLGVGFTLMESSAVVRLALLFGSTWVVNAVVFSAVLLTIFIANALVLRGLAPPLRAAWLGLGIFVLVNYAFPVSALFALGGAGRALAAAALVGLPVFCAALAFSHLFGRQPVTGYPLGINLVGAMAGGLLEYASMAIGMRSVWLIVFAVYALAWVSFEWAGRRTVPEPR
jgi:SAM-dependent methyltransferase